MFCVYLVIYSGDLLPPFYIGSTSVNKINSGYKGSVSSYEYKNIWKSELKNNPELFKIEIISIHETRKLAVQAEERIQRELNVVRSELFVNKSFAGCKFDSAGRTYEEIYGVEKAKELREKKSKFFKGRPSPLKGCKRSDEIKEKLRKPKSQESRVNYIKSATKARGRSVACIETREIFESIESAARATSGNAQSISDCATGKNHSAAGYHWVLTNKIDKTQYTLYEDTKKTIAIIKPERFILCVDLGIYFSLLPSDIAEFIDKQNIRSITSCIYNSLRSGAKAFGYYWKYINLEDTCKYIKFSDNYPDKTMIVNFYI